MVRKKAYNDSSLSSLILPSTSLRFIVKLVGTLGWGTAEEAYLAEDFSSEIVLKIEVLSNSLDFFSDFLDLSFLDFLLDNWSLSIDFVTFLLGLQELLWLAILVGGFLPTLDNLFAVELEGLLSLSFLDILAINM